MITREEFETRHKEYKRLLAELEKPGVDREAVLTEMMTIDLPSEEFVGE